MLVALPGALAVDGTDICRENGQRYDAATWQWDGTAWVKEYQRPGMQTTVTGDATNFDWTASRTIRSVFVVDESGSELIAERVKKGTVTEGPVTALVLCQRGSSGRSAAVVPPVEDGNVERNILIETPENEEIPEVPEFGSILAVGVMGLLGAALIISKKN